MARAKFQLAKDKLVAHVLVDIASPLKGVVKLVYFVETYHCPALPPAQVHLVVQTFYEPIELVAVFLQLISEASLWLVVGMEMRPDVDPAQNIPDKDELMLSLGKSQGFLETFLYPYHQVFYLKKIRSQLFQALRAVVLFINA